MDKTIFVLLDACQYEAASKYLGYLEHMIDYNKGAKYKVLGELPSLSKPMYATLFTGLPVCKHGVTCNEVGGVLPYDSVFSLCRKAGGRTAASSYSWHCVLRLSKNRVRQMQRPRICHWRCFPKCDRWCLFFLRRGDSGIFFCRPVQTVHT